MARKINIRGIFFGACNAVGKVIVSLFGLLTEGGDFILLEDGSYLESES